MDYEYFLSIDGKKAIAAAVDAFFQRVEAATTSKDLVPEVNQPC